MERKKKQKKKQKKTKNIHFSLAKYNTIFRVVSCVQIVFSISINSNHS